MAHVKFDQMELDCDRYSNCTVYEEIEMFFSCVPVDLDLCLTDWIFSWVSSTFLRLSVDSREFFRIPVNFREFIKKYSRIITNFDIFFYFCEKCLSFYEPWWVSEVNFNSFWLFTSFRSIFVSFSGFCPSCTGMNWRMQCKWWLMNTKSVQQRERQRQNCFEFLPPGWEGARTFVTCLMVKTDQSEFYEFFFIFFFFDRDKLIWR